MGILRGAVLLALLTSSVFSTELSFPSLHMWAAFNIGGVSGGPKNVANNHLQNNIENGSDYAGFSLGAAYYPTQRLGLYAGYRKQTLGTSYTYANGRDCTGAWVAELAAAIIVALASDGESQYNGSGNSCSETSTDPGPDLLSRESYPVGISYRYFLLGNDLAGIELALIPGVHFSRINLHRVPEAVVQRFNLNSPEVGRFNLNGIFIKTVALAYYQNISFGLGLEYSYYRPLAFEPDYVTGLSSHEFNFSMSMGLALF